MTAGKAVLIRLERALRHLRDKHAQLEGVQAAASARYAAVKTIVRHLTALCELAQRVCASDGAAGAAPDAPPHATAAEAGDTAPSAGGGGAHGLSGWRAGPAQVLQDLSRAPELAPHGAASPTSAEPVTAGASTATRSSSSTAAASQQLGWSIDGALAVGADHAASGGVSSDALRRAVRQYFETAGRWLP